MTKVEENDGARYRGCGPLKFGASCLPRFLGGGGCSIGFDGSLVLHSSLGLTALLSGKTVGDTLPVEVVVLVLGDDGVVSLEQLGVV